MKAEITMKPQTDRRRPIRLHWHPLRLIAGSAVIVVALTIMQLAPFPTFYKTLLILSVTPALTLYILLRWCPWYFSQSGRSSETWGKR